MRLFVEPRDSVARGSEHERRLEVQVPRQERTAWCWAAVATACADHYGVAGFDQPTIAAALIAQGLPGDAVGLEQHVDGSWRAPVDDNRYAELGHALRVVGCFGHWSPGRPPMARLVEEISAGRPVGVQIRWLTGGAHYALVVGCASRAAQLHIDDPWFGLSVQAYGGFPHSYHGRTGCWRGTYWTNPPDGP
jgi:hypothetical protein